LEVAPNDVTKTLHISVQCTKHTQHTLGNIYLYAVELHLSARWLSGSAWPFGEICREFYKTNLPWNYRLSDQVQYSVTAS